MTRTLLLALGALPLLAAAQNVGVDLDDMPSACRRVCNPIGRLSDLCDVDLRSDIDRVEDRLQNQCICTNDSFDVAQIAGLCASCIHQEVDNNRDNDDDDDDDDDGDDDDTRDIDQVMSICSFNSTSYAPSVTSQLSWINVSASRPTDIGQLTTTLGNAENSRATTDTISATSSSDGPSEEPMSTGGAAHAAAPLGGLSGSAALYLVMAGALGGAALIF